MRRRFPKGAVILSSGPLLVSMAVLFMLVVGCGTAATVPGTDTGSLTSEQGSSTTTTEVTSSSGPKETTAPGTVPSSSDLSKLVGAWKMKGIQVLSVGTAPDDPSHVIVKVAEAVLAPPDGVFASHQLERQAFLVNQQQGLPFDRFDVVTVDANGKEQLDFGGTLKAGMVVQPAWATPSLMEEATLKEKLDAMVTDTSAKAGVKLISAEFATPPDGRTFTITVTLAESTSDQRDSFLMDILVSLYALNRQGGHLAVLNLRVNDAAGKPILRTIEDFQLGSEADWWNSQEYMPPWVNPPPTTTTSG